LVRAENSTLADVLDRVLDKGIVIDGWHNYSLGGVQLGHIKSRMVVASLRTYLDRVDFLAEAGLLSSPPWLPTSTRSQTRRVRIIRRVS
jgi:gas vesicle protein GvpA/GvpJ/GvpM family